MPPIPGINPGEGDNIIHTMPAYIPAINSGGFKWVSGYPENHKLGLPYINGLIILNDPETDLPIAVMDCVWITAMRTAAAKEFVAKAITCNLKLAKDDMSVAPAIYKRTVEKEIGFG
jgi:ornithine cyclodeaminase/alanine dehydrogenase-like protein (mu-crystallin family)